MLKPWFDTLRMEVMRRITWQRSDFFIFLEVTLANGTFRVLFEVVRVVLAKHNLLNESFSFTLLFFQVLHVVFIHPAEAWEAANAEKKKESDHEHRPNGYNEQDKPDNEVKEVIA